MLLLFLPHDHRASTEKKGKRDLDQMQKKIKKIIELGLENTINLEVITHLDQTLNLHNITVKPQCVEVRGGS
jgi:hypothetical protein